MGAAQWVGIAAIASAVAMSPLARAQDVYSAPGRWLDDHSQVFKLESLHGEFAVATMAYGACRRVCSTSLRVMEQLQALSDARHLSINFVVVGLDPSEDTPQDWASLRTFRKLTRPNWQFLSGDEQSTRQMAQQLGVHYWRYGEHTMHDFRIVLLSPQGQVLRAINAFDDDLAALLP